MGLGLRRRFWGAGGTWGGARRLVAFWMFLVSPVGCSFGVRFLTCEMFSSLRSTSASSAAQSQKVTNEMLSTNYDCHLCIRIAMDKDGLVPINLQIRKTWDHQETVPSGKHTKSYLNNGPVERSLIYPASKMVIFPSFFVCLPGRALWSWMSGLGLSCCCMFNRFFGIREDRQTLCLQRLK